MTIEKTHVGCPQEEHDACGCALPQDLSAEVDALVREAILELPWEFKLFDEVKV